MIPAINYNSSICIDSNLHELDSIDENFGKINISNLIQAQTIIATLFFISLLLELVYQKIYDITSHR